METSDLYKLNKDELIYLISTIRDQAIKETEENISNDTKRLRYLLALQDLDEVKENLLKKYKERPEKVDLIMELTENAKKILYDLVYQVGFKTITFQRYLASVPAHLDIIGGKTARILEDNEIEWFDEDGLYFDHTFKTD